MRDKYLCKSMRGANMTLQKNVRGNYCQKVEFKFEFIWNLQKMFFRCFYFASGKMFTLLDLFFWFYWYIYIYILYKNIIDFSIFYFSPCLIQKKEPGAPGTSQANRPSRPPDAAHQRASQPAPPGPHLTPSGDCPASLASSRPAGERSLGCARTRWTKTRISLWVTAKRGPLPRTCLKKDLKNEIIKNNINKTNNKNKFN